MSQDNRRYDSKKTQKVSHYQKKVADRQRLEAVYKDKVRYSDGGVRNNSVSAHRGGSSNYSSSTQKPNGEQVSVSYLTEVDQSSAVLQEQYTQIQQDQQQQLFVYIPDDQSSYRQATFQNLPFDINTLVGDNQDSGFGTPSVSGTSQTIEPNEEFSYCARMFEANRNDNTSAVSATHQNEYRLVIEGPADPTDANGKTMYAAQHQQQRQPHEQSPSRYAPSPRTPPERSFTLSPARNDLDLERSLMSPNSPKSLMSPTPPRSPHVATTSTVAAEAACEDLANGPATLSPRVALQGSYSPYVPVASKNIIVTQKSVSYVPTACKNIDFATPISPSKLSATSTPKVASSRGKKISFNDAAPTHGTDVDSDTEPEEGNIDSIDDDNNSTTWTMEVFNKTPVPEKENVIADLQAFGDIFSRDTEHTRDDLFAVTESRVKLLTLVGKYADKKNNNNRFERGFPSLFKHGVPDLEKIWRRMKQTGGYVDTVKDKIPKSLWWLFVQLAICYYDFTDRSKTEFIAFASNKMRRTKGKTLETILRMAVGLTASVGKIYSGRKRQTGDEIDESDFAASASPSPHKRTKRNGPSLAYENEEYVESDTASVVSVMSTRRGTTVSGNSKNRIASLTMERFGGTSSSSAVAVPSSLHFERSESDVAIANIDGIHYQTTDQQIEHQGAVCTARPNCHLSVATKSVVLRTIEAKDREITFGNVVDMLVDKITERVFGRVVTNLAEICLKITEIIENNEKEAISFCTNLRSLVLTVTRIEFDAVARWCTTYCTALSLVFCRTSERIGLCEKNVLKTRLKEEYANIIEDLKSEMAESLKKYSATFGELARISDWCCYTIFGVSLSEKGDGTTDMSVLVKNVLSAWVILEKLPLNVNKDEAERLDRMLWCFPLAHLTRLGGFIVHAQKVRKPVACGLDEYFDGL